MLLGKPDGIEGGPIGNGPADPCRLGPGFNDILVREGEDAVRSRIAAAEPLRADQADTRSKDLYIGSDVEIAKRVREDLTARHGRIVHGRASLRSVEATLRNIPGLVDFIMKQVEESRAAADRLDAQAKRPFAQADKLAKRRQLLDDLVADLEANPAAPPSWPRHGAPLDTEIFVAGKAREVQGHRWTSDGYFIVTEEGPVPYLDAKAENGSALYDPHEFEAPVKESRQPEGEKQQRDMDQLLLP